MELAKELPSQASVRQQLTELDYSLRLEAPALPRHAIFCGAP